MEGVRLVVEKRKNGIVSRFEDDDIYIYILFICQKKKVLDLLFGWRGVSALTSVIPDRVVFGARWYSGCCLWMRERRDCFQVVFHWFTFVL